MKKILSNVLILLAFLSFFALPSYAQSSGDNTITGTIYDGFNNELVGFSFTVTVTRRDGVPISTAPKTVTTITAGALPGTFQLPRKSFVTFRGAFTIGRYNFANGLSMFIPDESTTSIYNLLSVEDAAAALVAVSSAPSDATYWTSSSNGTLSAEVNLGALTSGLLKHTVSGSVSTPATATAGTDYVAPGAITGAGLTQATGKLLGRYSASTGAIQEITISTGLSLDGSGNLTATASGGGTWGSITGTLSAQTDLQSALDAKQALDSDLTALAGNSTNGLWARTGSGTGSARTITGTADKITVTDGDGVAGNPTLTIASTYAGQTSITTLGTIATGTWNGTVIGSAYGGAGTVNGILKANGSGTVSAAVSGTDYAAVGAITGSGQTMATSRLLGRTTASTGAIEEITPAATFSFTAGGLDVATGGITNAMLAGSIANAKLANSGVTIGSTSVSLGATASTVAGLTLTTPTIASFNNANHNHADSTGGGQLTTAALTGLGTGVATALGVNVGSAGAFVVNGGAGGTPSSLTLTNATGLPLSTGVTGDLPFSSFVQAGSAGFVGATGAGDYSHRTPTQVTAALDAFVGDSGSGGTKGLVPAPTTGDATKYLKGDGTWATVSAAPGGSDTQLQRNNSGAFGGISGVTSDGTNVTAGSGNLRATSPRITTDISDSNGNEIFKLTATGSAVNEITVANAATGNSPTLTASGEANVGINFTGAGTGGFAFTTGATTGTGTSSGFSLAVNSLTTGTGAYFASSSLTTGNIINIASTSTVSDSSAALNIAVTGANSTSAKIVKGAKISVTNTNATSGFNYALELTASGATGSIGSGENRALNITAGQSVFPDADAIRPAITFSTNKATGIYLASSTVLGFTSNASASMAINGFDLVIQNNGSLGITSAAGTTADVILDRVGAGHWKWGSATAAASPVAQTQSAQDGTGTNIAGATWTMRGSLGTSQGAPGRIHLSGGAMIAASGTTAQTAVDRIISGATKVLTNNSAVTLVNVTAAADTNAGGVIDYVVEVQDGTDVQYEVGSVAYGVSNKGGVFSGNTTTKFGNHQNATSGTLTVTFAISGANPALFSVNANSSLTPSTGFPRITYTLRNLGQQAVAVQ